jgi:hypothetical protein
LGKVELRLPQADFGAFQGNLCAHWGNALSANGPDIANLKAQDTLNIP